MFRASADESGRILTMSYSHHVGAAEMRCCLGTVRDLLTNLQPGFLLLTDLSGLDSMETDCAPYMAEIMDLCNAKEIKTVLRVVPDPSKDIGYSLISLFHDDPKVDTRTYDNLASAIESLTPSEPAAVSG
ncbi:MAG TPA: hypothetical protein VGO11_00815 [Chthoniobacteraceae bacterium]|jgi:hypothetical protein|nr:hypothetical protein [Chthoniobacteraceae bacterium]